MAANPNPGQRSTTQQIAVLETKHALLLRPMLIRFGLWSALCALLVFGFLTAYVALEEGDLDGALNLPLQVIAVSFAGYKALTSGLDVRDARRAHALELEAMRAGA